MNKPILVLLTSLAFLLLALAGCLSGDDELDDSGGQDGDDNDQVALGADEGGLHGRVLNDGLEPVAGATVRDRATDIEDTTDGNGTYRLIGLEPGDQNIVVEASGHAPTVERVELIGGELLRKDFMIERVRGADPYTELLHQVGFLECQVGLAVLLANCIPIQNVLNDLGYNPTDTEQIHKWEINPTDGLQAIVLEMVWEPTPLTTTEEMVFLVERDGDGLGGGTWGSVQGPSVLKYVIDKDTPNGEGTYLPEIIEAAEDDEPYQTRVFPPSDLGNMVFQQVFEIYASHFYYSLPGDNYSAVPDG